MCPWVGSHAPSCGRQLWGLPSCVEYISPQGVLLPRVYSTIASPLWLEFRGHAAWEAAPAWALRRHTCHQLLPWLQVTFAPGPDAAWPGSDQWPWSTAPATGPVGWLGRPTASHPWDVVRCILSLCRPRCVCCAVSWPTWHLFTGAHALCVSCAVSVATWLLFTRVCAVCGMRVLVVVLSPLLPPSLFFVLCTCFCFLCFFSLLFIL